MHHFVLEKLNLAVTDQVSATNLRREVAALVADELKNEQQQLSSEAFKTLIDELIDEVLGLGPLEPLLADPSISDILVNGPDTVYVERGGMLERVAVSFSSERHLLRIIDKIVSRIGRRIDESQPWVDARLEDGSRVNAIIKPCAIDGASLSIRKFSRRPLTLNKLVDHGALSKNAMRFFRAVVQARLNVLISGGTGSGKATMLNAMSSFIDERQRIVTIEDAAELQLQQDHVVRLETRPPNADGAGAIAQRDLVKNALRMRPDRIVIGEVRVSEAFDMLQAMNTGHDGSMTTIHAYTARDALSRLEQMVSMIGGDFPLNAIRGQIGADINLVVQLNRLSDGSRRVMSISEITGLEGDKIMMQDIFVFERQGRAEDGTIKGVFKATGIRPAQKTTLLNSIPIYGTLPAKMRQAGMTMMPLVFLTFCAAVAFALFCLAIMVVGVTNGNIIAVLSGTVIAMSVINIIRKKHVEKFSQLLPDALDLMMHGLRVGHPLNVTITNAADNMPDPFGTEFRIMADQITAPDYYSSVSDDPLFMPIAIAIAVFATANLVILRNLVNFRI